MIRGTFNSGRVSFMMTYSFSVLSTLCKSPLDNHRYRHYHTPYDKKPFPFVNICTDVYCSILLRQINSSSKWFWGLFSHVYPFTRFVQSAVMAICKSLTIILNDSTETYTVRKKVLIATFPVSDAWFPPYAKTQNTFILYLQLRKIQTVFQGCCSYKI